MGVSNDKESGSVDPTSRDSSDTASDTATTSGVKSCADCRTTKTPLWRGGPNGPKSLCNACGIRFRKRRREGMGTKEKVVVLKKQRSSISNSLNRKWKQRRLGEEEQAAVLLMALSSGFFYS